jgi:hypothetical protein
MAGVVLNPKIMSSPKIMADSKIVVHVKNLHARQCVRATQF